MPALDDSDDDQLPPPPSSEESSDEELHDFHDSAAWRAAERTCHIKDAGRQRPRQASPAAAPSCISGDFHACKEFRGPVEGFAFKTSACGTGYHRDVMHKAPEVVICLDALTTQEFHEHDRLYDKRPARHARLPGGLRKRRKARVPASDAAIASLDAILCGHTEFSSNEWGPLGLWALDTVNGNSWDTVTAKVLPRSSADVLFVQEAKAVGEHGVAKVRRTGRKAGWNCVASPALRVADSFGSGGCVVAASRGVGITSQPDWAIRDGFQHRFKLAWVGAILRGGIHMGSLYLRDSAGLSEENLGILQEVAIVLKKLRLCIPSPGQGWFP